MHKARNQACLSVELLTVLVRQVDTHHFDGRLHAKVQVFPQVDFRNYALTKQSEQAIVANLLTYPVSHGCTSSCCMPVAEKETS